MKMAREVSTWRSNRLTEVGARPSRARSAAHTFMPPRVERSTIARTARSRSRPSALFAGCRPKKGGGASAELGAGLGAGQTGYAATPSFSATNRPA